MRSYLQEEHGGSRSKSLSDAIWQGIQEHSVKAANEALSMAGKGVLYVAKEIVFALSGDIQAADADDYGMTNDVEEERGPIETEHRRKKKKKPKKKKQKRNSNEPLEPVFHFDKASDKIPEERRDEVSEPAYHIRELIHKFDRPAGATPMPKNWKAERSPANQSVKQYSQMRIIQSSQTSTDPGRPQEIFRRRSELAMDNSERFAYLTADQQSKPNRRQEVVFSPLVSFKQLHQANKTALFDDSTVDTNELGTLSESEAYVESFLNKTAEPSMDLPPTNRKIEQLGEIDIRAEIEDIQRIVAKFEKERAERRKYDEEHGPTQSTDGKMANKKDPRRAEEIRRLVQRLERLSARYKELKARKYSRQPQVHATGTDLDTSGIEVFHPPTTGRHNTATFGNRDQLIYCQ